MREKPFFEWPGLGLKVADCLGTDMGALDFLKLARDFGHGGMTLYSGSGPTAGEVDDSAGGLWLCYENPDGWKAVMDVVNAGGDPSSVNANEYLNQQADAYYPYDEYGNLAKKTQGDDITLYRYNAQGLLSEKTAPNGDTVSYGYCADGTLWRYETSDFFGKPKEIGFYNPVCGWIAIALD